MNPWCYLIMLGWVAGGVSSWTRTGIWLLVPVVLSGLASVVVASNGSILPSLPGPLFSVGTIAASVSGAVLFFGRYSIAGYEARRPKESKRMGQAPSAIPQL